MCLSVYFIVAWIIFYTHRLKFRSLYNGATQIESHLFLYLLRWYKNDNNNRKMSLVECGREAYLYTKMCERSQSLSQSGQSLIFSLHFLCSVQRYLFNFLFIFFLFIVLVFAFSWLFCECDSERCTEVHWRKWEISDQAFLLIPVYLYVCKCVHFLVAAYYFVA